MSVQQKPGNGDAGPVQGEPSAGCTPSSNSSPLLSSSLSGKRLFPGLVLAASLGLSPQIASGQEATAPSGRSGAHDQRQEATPAPSASTKSMALPKGLALKRKPKTPDEIKKAIREASDQYEKYFLTQMLKAMRSTVSDKGGILPAGQGQKIFQEQLDDQYIEAWSKRGGVGYSDLIYNQVLERYGAQMGLRPREVKPKGPIPVDNKQARIHSFQEQSVPSQIQESDK